MTSAPRAKPEDFFTPDEWLLLSSRSSFKGLALLLHCWVVIGIAIATGVAWPITIPLMVMVVGARQLGLFILMHDAAHGLLHPDRRINDRAALWFGGSELHIYRPYHLQHHRFVQQTADPDLVLSAPFPISPESLRRKIVRDLTGQTFGYLTVISRAGTTKHGCATWHCRCQCGKLVPRQSQYLRNRQRKHPRSCGCHYGDSQRTHGMTNTIPFYKWSGMRNRCHNPRCKDYKNWGARGITVCARWRESFEAFWADMGPSYKPGLSLGRINNSKGYSPKNCRWETAKEQGNNTRCNIFIVTPKGRMTIAQAAETYGIPVGTLHARIRRYGWTVKSALNPSTTWSTAVRVPGSWPKTRVGNP